MINIMQLKAKIKKYIKRKKYFFTISFTKLYDGEIY